MEAIDKEIAKLQGKSLNDAAHAIELNADTLEHIVRQAGEHNLCHLIYQKLMLILCRAD